MLDDALGLDKEDRQGREHELSRPLFQDLFGVSIDAVHCLSNDLRGLRPMTAHSAIQVFERVVKG